MRYNVAESILAIAKKVMEQTPKLQPNAEANKPFLESHFRQPQKNCCGK